MNKTKRRYDSPNVTSFEVRFEGNLLESPDGDVTATTGNRSGGYGNGMIDLDGD